MRSTPSNRSFCSSACVPAARHGLKCELVLSRNVASNHPEYDRTGNVLLDRIFGAGLNFVPRDIDWATELEKVAEVVRRRGGKPFVIPIGGSTPTGALGYVGCAQEILQQAAGHGHRRRCRGPLLGQRRDAIRPAGWLARQRHSGDRDQLRRLRGGDRRPRPRSR